MKVVLDANAFVGAVLKAGGPSARVLLAWRTALYQLVTSPALLEELEDVLARPKIASRTSYAPEDLAALIQDLWTAATVVRPAFELDVVRDPDDNRVLEAAVEGEADYIVSSDNDLLDLGSYEGITIVTPSRFLSMLAEALKDEETP